MRGGGPLTLGEIAEALGLALEGDPDRKITGVAPLETAGPDQISFLTHPRYASLARTTRAGALLVPRDVKLPGPLLRADNPQLALAELLQLFYPAPIPPGGVHASAQVDPSAQVHPTATVGALAVIGNRTVVGARTWIFPLVYVGDRAEIGADCVIYPHVVICEGVKLGNRVIVHPGAVLGADGFGYVFNGTRHRKIPQVGGVLVEDEVEIGANVTVDRATLGQTVIRRGTKIDNLVQIGHNVEIGEDSIVVAQVGISGSSKVGKRVILAGQAGIIDHVTVADGAMVGAQSGVAADLAEAGPYLGTPARPAAEGRRIYAALPRLPALLRKVRALERRVRELEGRLGLTLPDTGDEGDD
ncbi:MAG: UDP-3-O-(3-hydroxymyristoyl)glucosamine N-acyltransferase [Candidatus Rokubacteria bacterium]|nr:UDP-3-O-(3-hydroxymyristoyl)glucosamine N-acyltransferase [Candidatus Rokubacteria bacterium]